MNKKKILFIINPISGTGRKKYIEKNIHNLLDKSLFEYDISYTKYPHHAIEITGQAIKNGLNIIVAVGGDGSINDIAQCLVKSNIVLGIIPTGSGNGLARHLKIPICLTKSIDIINKQNIIKIDTATINEKLFFSIAGIGFDALIAEKFAQSKRRGFITYFRSVIREYLKYYPQKYIIEINNEKIIRELMFISCANSNQFGYNVSLSPSASLSDGLLDICIVNKMSFLNAAIQSQRLFFKKTENSKYIEVYRVKEAMIECNDLTNIHIDGEPAGKLIKFHIKINPQELNIIVP